MNPCQNCGKLNTPETNFCRFCGTKFMYRQAVPDDSYDYSAPRPYAWKTDEFQVQNEPRPTEIIDRTPQRTGSFSEVNHNYGPAPLAYPHPQSVGQPFRCPYCMSQYLPRIERRISTAGWITFSVLLVFFFPLFWIGLLLKEDVPVCQTCNSKIQIQR